MLFPSLYDRTDHVPSEYYPYDCYGNVNGPLKFGIFLGRGQSQRQCYGRRQDDQLPSPEIDPAQHIAVHSCFQEPLQGIIDSRKHRVPHKSKDDSVRMEWPDPTECRILEIKIEDRIEELNSRRKTHKHSHQTKYNGSDNKDLYDLVIVAEFLKFHIVLRGLGPMNFSSRQTIGNAQFET
jgi:hypothetical protein